MRTEPAKLVRLLLVFSFMTSGVATARTPQQGWNHPWGPDAVVYGIVPPLFGKQPFKDVEARLPALQSLGVNTLWFSPINATIPGDFGYSVTSYFDLRSDYGSKEEFRSLVRRAHALGMKVIMDFVPNHSAQEHPFFEDALANGRSSPYYGFYDWKGPKTPEHYFDWKHLPNLNFDNPLVDDMIGDALEYWVRDFDVDGYRVDVAWGVQQRDAQFWPKVRSSLVRLEPQTFLLAEASAKDPTYFRNGFDAAYDWTQELGKWAWEKVWEPRAQIAQNLRRVLAEAQRPPGGMVFRFLNNNDTGERFITRHGPELTRAAAVLLLTTPGIPLVYTGDEVGAAYKPYEEPPPLDWKDPHQLRPHYQKLIATRQKLSALRSPRFTLIEAEPASALAYVRTREDGSEPVLVVIQFADAPAEVRLKLTPKLAAQLGTRVVDHLSGESLPLQTDGAKVRLNVPAWMGRVLTRER